MSTRRSKRAGVRPEAVFAALADETRLRLVTRLSAAGPQSIARLTTGTAVSRQAVTKHLRVLEQAGLACSARSGRERVWRFQSAPLVTARHCLDGISALWDATLGRLTAFVER